LQIKMPKLNDTEDPGVVQEILLQVGEQVEVDDPVMTVEMEKSVVDIESMHAGTVKEILVAEGDTVAVGQVLMELE